MLRFTSIACLARRRGRSGEPNHRGASTCLDFRTQDSAICLCRTHARAFRYLQLPKPQRSLSDRPNAGKILPAAAAFVGADFLSLFGCLRDRLFLCLSGLSDWLRLPLLRAQKRGSPLTSRSRNSSRNCIPCCRSWDSSCRSCCNSACPPQKIPCKRLQPESKTESSCNPS